MFHSQLLPSVVSGVDGLESKQLLLLNLVLDALRDIWDQPGQDARDDEDEML